MKPKGALIELFLALQFSIVEGMAHPKWDAKRWQIFGITWYTG